MLSPRSSAAPPRPAGSSPLALSRNVGGAERVASTLGGGLLLFYGLARGSLGGALLAGLGGVLAFRGVTGHCPAFAALGLDTAGGQPEPVEVEEAVTVMAPRGEVYAFWRRLENLPRFMHHLRRVRALGDGRSHWVAKGPGALPDIEWLAEVIEEREGEVLAWRSLAGADVANAGRVRFSDAPGGGTEVRAYIAYRPPAGSVGAAVARRLDPVLGQLVKEDVRRFKRVMESGEIPTTDGQPSGKP